MQRTILNDSIFSANIAKQGFQHEIPISVLRSLYRYTLWHFLTWERTMPVQQLKQYLHCPHYYFFHIRRSKLQEKNVHMFTKRHACLVSTLRPQLLLHCTFFSAMTTTEGGGNSATQKKKMDKSKGLLHCIQAQFTWTLYNNYFFLNNQHWCFSISSDIS